MKRALYRQMRHEWRDNLWLVIGLSVVGLAVWGLGAQLYGTLKYAFLPMGFEDKDLYIVAVGDVSADNEDYVDYGEDGAGMRDNDIRTLLQEYRSNPNVEAAAISSCGSPYMVSRYWTCFLADEADSLGYIGSSKSISPEMVDVLGLKSATGESGESLKKMLEEGKILITSLPRQEGELRESGKHLPEDYKGKKVKDNPDGDAGYVVGDVVDVIRQSRFHTPRGMFLMPLGDADLGRVTEIMVRVKPGRGEAFVGDYESRREMQRLHNVSLGVPAKVAFDREAAERDDTVNARLFVSLIVFLFVIIFLGLLGSFWFRVQQRTGEIAIRKVCGATDRDIFRRLIGEGMILMVLSALLSGCVGWVTLLNIDTLSPSEIMEAFMAEGISILVVVSGVVLSIWWPASKAMKIEPALAIKDD